MRELSLFENGQEKAVGITVKNENGIQYVSARDLHFRLEIATAFKDWFPRICEYGFTLGVDFNPLKIEQVRVEGNREVKRELQDFAITIEMAKQICMLQRSDKGRLYREYFIRLEKAWNTPEAVMARALQVANITLENAKKQIEVLTPKAEWYDNVADSANLTEIGTVGKMCGIGDKKIFSVLSENKIIYKKCDSDGVAYYVPYFEYEKYFKSVPEPFLRGDKKLVRNKLLFTQNGVVWATKRFMQKEAIKQLI